MLAILINLLLFFGRKTLSPIIAINFLFFLTKRVIRFYRRFLGSTCFILCDIEEFYFIFFRRRHYRQSLACPKMDFFFLVCHLIDWTGCELILIYFSLGHFFFNYCHVGPLISIKIYFLHFAHFMWA